MAISKYRQIMNATLKFLLDNRHQFTTGAAHERYMSFNGIKRYYEPRYSSHCLYTAMGAYRVAADEIFVIKGATAHKARALVKLDQALAARGITNINSLSYDELCDFIRTQL